MYAMYTPKLWNYAKKGNKKRTAINDSFKKKKKKKNHLSPNGKFTIQ